MFIPLLSLFVPMIFIDWSLHQKKRLKAFKVFKIIKTINICNFILIVIFLIQYLIKINLNP